MRKHSKKIEKKNSIQKFFKKTDQFSRIRTTTKKEAIQVQNTPVLFEIVPDTNLYCICKRLYCDGEQMMGKLIKYLIEFMIF